MKINWPRQHLPGTLQIAISSELPCVLCFFLTQSVCFSSSEGNRSYASQQRACLSLSKCFYANVLGNIVIPCQSDVHWWERCRFHLAQVFTCYYASDFLEAFLVNLLVASILAEKAISHIYVQRRQASARCFSQGSPTYCNFNSYFSVMSFAW